MEKMNANCAEDKKCEDSAKRIEKTKNTLLKHCASETPTDIHTPDGGLTVKTTDSREIYIS